GTCRTLTSRPVTAAAIGLPPEATRPTNMNCAAPAKTATDNNMGSHTGSPELTVMAPNETPTTASARQTSATSRARPSSNVRHIERIGFHGERERSRSSSRTYRLRERTTENADTTRAPLAVIASSLQRERRRAGLSLAEVARRAGIAKSTLSQL